MIQSEEEINKIKKELEQILDKFTAAVMLNPDDILVVGCSTSEVTGGIIGKSWSYAVGEVIARTFIEKIKPLQVNIAFQCCEHLNRALVVERELAKKRNNLEIVSAVPQENAGGSIASAAYKLFAAPVLVEFIKADAGIDIGDTFVGMHLKHVAVPVRLDTDKLGAAHVTFARTRPKYIGGERAKYSCIL